MKKEVRKFYDMLSDDYDELYGEEQRVKHLAILEECNLNGIIGDMGCGTCLLVEQLFKPKYSVRWYIGLDISKGMIRIARERVNKVANADLIVGDIENLPFRENSVDFVLAVTSLQNVPSIRIAVSELGRVTRRGLIVSLLKVARNSKEAIKELMETFSLRKIIMMEKDIALLFYKPSTEWMSIPISRTPKRPFWT